MGMCFYMIINFEKEIKSAIRHDFHKLKGAKHTNDARLSTRADADASRMSRPPITKKPIYDEDVSNYRLSLCNGETNYKHGQENRDTLCSEIRRNYNVNNSAEVLYNTLLNCNLLSMFNEAPDLPYTSLKYHTILTTNLHWNYLQNKELKELQLKIIPIEQIESQYDFIYIDKENSKGIVMADKDKYNDFEAISNIGSKPFTNFGDVLSRMYGVIYFNKYLYANLRRIKSWSIGLQYLEDCSKSRGSL